MFLFIILAVSTLLTFLTVYDESPLAIAIDLIMKILVVIGTAIYFLDKL